MRLCGKVLDKATSSGLAVASAITVILGLMTSSAVVARYVLHRPIIGVDELAAYLMMAIVFVGLAEVVRSGSHIEVDLVYQLLSKRVQQALQKVNAILGLCVGLTLIAGTYRILSTYYTMGYRSASTLEVPMWIPAAVLFVGCVLFGLQLVADVVRRFGSR